MGPIGCPETSVRNYNYTSLNPEDVTDSLSRNVGKKLQLHALDP